jgi:hypothetical protein
MLELNNYQPIPLEQYKDYELAIFDKIEDYQEPSNGS